VAAQRVGAGPPDDRPQDQGHDDHVVGVPEDGDEVRHQVDRRGQVAEQQHQAQPHATGQRPVGRQTAQQPQQVGQQAEDVAQPERLGVTAGRHQQRSQHDQVGDEEAGRHGDQRLPPAHAGSLRESGSSSMFAIVAVRSPPVTTRLLRLPVPSRSVPSISVTGQKLVVWLRLVAEWALGERSTIGLSPEVRRSGLRSSAVPEE
jgi:hypothetical protein